MASKILSEEGRKTLICNSPSVEGVAMEESGAASIEDSEVHLKNKRSRDVGDADDESTDPKVRPTGKTGEVVATVAERPSRERRTVERYMALSPLRSSATKTIAIQQGYGTKLKDIPNVFYMLSKRKIDADLQALHRVLYGRRANVHSMKKNIYDFSGFIWDGEKEKHSTKLKEKLYKYKKDQLFEFCKMLDIAVVKAGPKEDLVEKLLSFLKSPHATRSVLLSEKHETSKRLKRSKRSSGTKTSKEKTKKPKKGSAIKARKKRKLFDIDEDNDVSDPESTHTGEESGDMDINGDSDKGTSSDGNKEEEQMKYPEPGKEESDTDVSEKRCETKINTKPSMDSQNATLESKRPRRPVNYGNQKDSHSKKERVKNIVSSLKDSTMSLEDDMATPDHLSGKMQVIKAETKVSRKIQEEKQDDGEIGNQNVAPKKDELHSVTRKILKEVDFEKATVSDILKKLGTHFKADLMPRKAEIKKIMEEIISSMIVDDEDEKEEQKEGLNGSREANGCEDLKQEQEVNGEKEEE